jgi:hypothetical protein
LAQQFTPEQQRIVRDFAKEQFSREVVARAEEEEARLRQHSTPLADAAKCLAGLGLLLFLFAIDRTGKKTA